MPHNFHMTHHNNVSSIYGQSKCQIICYCSIHTISMITMNECRAIPDGTYTAQPFRAGTDFRRRIMMSKVDAPTELIKYL